MCAELTLNEGQAQIRLELTRLGRGVRWMGVVGGSGERDRGRRRASVNVDLNRVLRESRRS